MIELLAAALFFLLIHFGVAGTRLRDALVARLGERSYLALFSIASVAGIVWLASAYARAPHLELWGQLHALKPLVLVLMALAVGLAVLGLTSPNPTAVGGERLLEHPRARQGASAITRHPFLWGTALWAAVHLLVNGDLPSLVLFGALLVLAVGGTFSIDARRARRPGSSWEAYARATSNVPFVALVRGRARLRLADIGWWRLALVPVVYAGLLWMHPHLFGVSPLP